TNISFDHTEVLGPTLEDIARDKSGIFKPGSRVVIGESDPTLVSQLCQAAADVGAAETWVRGRDFACSSNRMAVGGRLVDIRTPAARYGELLLPLHGAHQGENASCALAAVEAFFGVPLGDDVVERALSEVRVPGRLEVIGRHPLVIVDGAHNVAGMIVLARSLVEEFEVVGRTEAVVGMLAGRDPAAMLDALLTAGVRSIVACAPRSPRALPADVVAAAAAHLGMAVLVAPDPGEATHLALGRAGPEDRVVVCGSLYVVADARRLLVHDVA
ncbi:MAG: bifunctional folylpolyglutamate synthase/dihydrofolate synthase, partial [Acidimicrobiales bacterium]